MGVRLMLLNQNMLDYKMRKLHEEGKDFCSRCEESDFSPNVEAWEISGELVCDDCAEEVFEENSRFGVGS